MEVTMPTKLMIILAVFVELYGVVKKKMREAIKNRHETAQRGIAACRNNDPKKATRLAGPSAIESKKAVNSGLSKAIPSVKRTNTTRRRITKSQIPTINTKERNPMTSKVAEVIPILKRRPPTRLIRRCKISSFILLY